jgi:hypothetical protein
MISLLHFASNSAPHYSYTAKQDRSSGSSVSTVTMLRDGQPGLNSRQGQGRKGFLSFRHRVQTYSGAHPASYPVGTRGSFPGGKAAGA